jgi:signal transduction histidine kinase
LGLATVHGLAAQPGGAVAVESEPDRDSTFTVYLPLARDDA